MLQCKIIPTYGFSEGQRGKFMGLSICIKWYIFILQENMVVFVVTRIQCILKFKMKKSSFKLSFHCFADACFVRLDYVHFKYFFSMFIIVSIGYSAAVYTAYTFLRNKKIYCFHCTCTCFTYCTWIYYNFVIISFLRNLTTCTWLYINVYPDTSEEAMLIQRILLLLCIVEWTRSRYLSRSAANGKLGHLI